MNITSNTNLIPEFDKKLDKEQYSEEFHMSPDDAVLWWICVGRNPEGNKKDEVYCSLYLEDSPSNDHKSRVIFKLSVINCLSRENT